MKQFKISTRLIALVVILTVLLIAVGSMGLIGISQSNAALKTVYERRTTHAVQLAELKELVVRDQLAANTALASPDREFILTQEKLVHTNAAAADKVIQAYLESPLDEDETQLSKELLHARKRLLDEGLLPAFAALRRLDLEQANAALTDKVRPLAVAADQAAAALLSLQVSKARQDYDAASARFIVIRQVSLATILLGVAFASCLGFVTSRSITRELGAQPTDAKRVAQVIAAGDLSQGVAVRAGDTTSLMAFLDSMLHSLANVVVDVRRNADNVSNASAEIAQGNADLSRRTEMQASELEQTAASMEQLGTTVRENAERARTAETLAHDASGFANRSGEIVAGVVETMQGIDDGARRIVDIIGVIDGIAFQTNILAFNAAVEAARAGEQGRSFAVVAGDVRDLAQRTSIAAKEVRKLITDTVGRVQRGNAFVAEAKLAMSDVVTAGEQLATLVRQISKASSEQSLEVEAVGDAISRVDSSTQHNAALVEEIAASAASLQQQAQQLVQAVAVFKLGH